MTATKTATRTENADYILAAYINIIGGMANSTGTGTAVGIRQLRARVGLTRGEFDAALLDLMLTDEETGLQVSVDPEPKQRGLTPADHAAAVVWGEEAKHLVTIVKRPVW